jgi:hypothetical protein
MPQTTGTLLIEDVDMEKLMPRVGLEFACNPLRSSGI